MGSIIIFMNSQPSFWQKIANYFSIKHEQEEICDIMQTIKNGLIFKGTNLIILIFAILLACIGLNIDSLVVLLGAMLVSPVM